MIISDRAELFLMEKLIIYQKNLSKENFVNFPHCGHFLYINTTHTHIINIYQPCETSFHFALNFREKVCFIYAGNNNNDNYQSEDHCTNV